MAGDSGAPDREFAPGQVVFGHFTLIRELGRGGMGVVWLVRDELLKHEVALKFLPRSVTADRVSVDDLKKETRRALQLTHPHIVRVHAFHQDEARAGISMEWVDGPTLRDLRLDEPHEIFEPRRILPWIKQLAEAPDYAHTRARIVHRDLKPANLMVSAAGELKITDFGISASVSESVLRVSRVREVSCTPAYASPQQLSGEMPAASDDLYSLGATLYELLTGKPPFFLGDIESQVRDRERRPASMKDRRRELGVTSDEPIPANWEEAVAVCLAKERAGRPASAADVVRLIEQGDVTVVNRRVATLPAGEEATVVTPRRQVTEPFQSAPVKATVVTPLPKPSAIPPKPPTRIEPARPSPARSDEGRPGPSPGLSRRSPKAEEEGRRPPSGLAREDMREVAQKRGDEKGGRRPPGGVLRFLSAFVLISAVALALFLWQSWRASPGPLQVPSATDTGATKPAAVAPVVPETQHPESLPATTPGEFIVTAPAADPYAAVAEVLPATFTGEFIVTVTPADAAARLWLGSISDGEVKDGRVVLREVPDGEHDLVVTAPGYQPFNTKVTVTNGAGSVAARLVPVRGAVQVKARPGSIVTAVDAAGRTTRLGEVAAAGTLLSENVLMIGRYTLRLEHPDCAPVSAENVELVVGRTMAVTPAQTPLPGELRVFSVPQGAAVRVNGVDVGQTPATLRRQPSEQKLVVEVFLRGYRRIAQDVTLQPKEVRTLNLGALVAEAGGVDFRFANFDFGLGGARLSIDGREVKPARSGANWRVDDLELGARTVEITHADYEPWKQSVTVRDQQRTAVNVTLAPKPGSVAFSSTPAGATVAVTGGELRQAAFRNDAGTESTTPFRGSLAPGDYVVTYSLAGHKAAEKTVTVAANRSVELAAVLEKQSGPVAGQPFENSLGMKFVPVPGTDVSFCIWETRVQDYEAFSRATNRGWAKSGDATHPAVNVSWDDAKAFCTWLTQRERAAGRLTSAQEYRLPRDWEWSVAVRLSESRSGSPQSKDMKIDNVFPWGTQWLPPRGAGNYGGLLNVDSFDDTSPVGSFAANRYGINDLGGNVWEWVEDFYDGSSGSRVLRGASYTNSDRNTMLSSYRNRNTRTFDYRYYFLVGFRVVCAVGSASSPVGDAGTTSIEAPDEIARPVAGQPFENSLGMEFVPVPGTDVSFCIWETRVQDYEAFSRATNRGWAKSGDAAHPAANVSWDDATAFCAWLTQRERAAGRLTSAQEYRLPRDWEWSVAVGLNESRDGSPQSKDEKFKDVYPWGTQWPPPRGAGNYADAAAKRQNPTWTVIDGYDDGFASTAPVGSFAANRFGLFDLGGNVWEWVEDFYDGSSGKRALRGASFSPHVRDYPLASFRYFLAPDYRLDYIGFRVVCAVGGASSR